MVLQLHYGGLANVQIGMERELLTVLLVCGFPFDVPKRNVSRQCYGTVCFTLGKQVICPFPFPFPFRAQVSTGEQVADTLTKALPEPAFKKHCEVILGNVEWTTDPESTDWDNNE